MAASGFEYVPQTVTQTATANHSDVDHSGYDGVIVMIDVTSVDTGDADETYTFKIQGKDPISDSYYDILSSGDVAGDGATLHVLEVHPALAEEANVKESALLPDQWRLRVELAGTTPSIDYTVYVVEL